MGAASDAVGQQVSGKPYCTIIVSTANPFARDLIGQQVRFAWLRERGVDLLQCCPQRADRQLGAPVLVSIAESDNAMMAASLRGARGLTR